MRQTHLDDRIMPQEIPWDHIVAVGKRTMIHRALFAVAWNLGRYCNYSCSYCWPHAHSTIKSFRRFSELTRTIDEIKTHARGFALDWLHFSFSGGEPTLNPHFLDLLRYIVDLPDFSKSIHITSNISPGTRWWTQFCRLLDALPTKSITASWHPEAGSRDPKGHRARFAEKVSLLQSQGLHNEINVIMVPQHFDSLIADAEFFQSYGLRATLKPLTVDDGRVIAEYTAEQSAVLRHRHSYPAPTSSDPVSKARKQLPKDRPGIIFVKVQPHWFTDPEIYSMLGDVTRHFFRNTRRIISVKYFVNQFDYLDDAILHTHRYREMSNPQNCFDPARTWQLFKPGDQQSMWNGMPSKWVRLVNFEPRGTALSGMA